MKKKHLVSFESGHYKEMSGEWIGDSVWMHIRKPGKSVVHINKDKVEYVEVFDPIDE